MIPFALATLTPAALLILGALRGGAWVWAAVLCITIVCAVLDRLIPRTPGPGGSEFPTGNALSATLSLLHLPMLLLATSAIGAGDLPVWDRLGLLIGFGLFFGQIGHPNAHELIHRPGRFLRGLGGMVYGTLLIGHHVSAHRLVHHVHVGTDADPNSARKGLGFWRFAPRAWIGSFRAGWQAENALRSRRCGALTLHPYVFHAGWALAALGLSFAFARINGALALLGVAAYAQLQILLADYVQHYGLRRAPGPNGKPEPIAPRHAWNSPHAASSAMMLNAPRHSDHHLHPMRPYPGLRLDPDMPLLPHALPVMAVIALWPPLWRRLMDPLIR
ncbi:alkane 1-monooxygenase [Thalassovita sp.]|uniref:alkane 1-monooxygenase n=1 Tax=Thalassovita sp. TaxID=1979401 RepID=UPI0029DE64BB|nr:alkane 1-monooxygenase [Thalassovita sp.]